MASPGDKERLATDSQLIYEEGPPIGSGWVIWRSY